MNNLLGSNIKVSVRKLMKDKYYSFINIFGLALGIAGSFVIGSWVWQELNYDAHYLDSDRIYRVSVGFYNSGAFARGPEKLNTVLRDQAPEVEIATRVVKSQPEPLTIEDKTFEVSPFYVDSTFFKVFDHEFILGNAETALTAPNNIILTTAMADKLFGSTDILGKSVIVGDDKKLYQVAGIIKKSDHPTHLDSDIWMPLEIKGNKFWTSAYCFNYIKLHPNSSQNQLEERLEQFKKELVFPDYRSSQSYADWKGLGIFDFYIKPLKAIHLDPPMKFDLQAGGNRANVFVFMMVSIFLLAIAVINFVNLSTAQSAKRAKEVGVRKALGTSRFSLIKQYLIESIVLSMIAMLLGIALSELFLILFQSYTNEVLINGLFSNGINIALFVTLTLAIGVIAGLYPAFYLSRFKTIDVFKMNKSKGSSTFRNVLVVFQFTISIVLIICSILVYQQLQHLKKVDLGFDRENVLVINNIDALGGSKEAFKEKLAQHSAVKTVSFNKRVPAGSSVWLYSFQSEAMDQDEGFQTFIGDENYLDAMGFRLLEGRNFNRDIASDSTAVILTKSAARDLLLGDKVLGAELGAGYHVVGVVSDFTYQGFDAKPDPVVILYNPEGYRLSVRLTGNQTSEFISYMNTQWQLLTPDKPVNYAFVDDNFESLMVKERTLGKTISFFTSIAILISCLGLFGLAAFTTEQRQKEIGIRKVLGASVKSVVMLLNKKFFQLVLVAVIISMPLAWYLMKLWLQNFEYKMEVNYLVFIISGAIALFVAWITVSYLSITAASANPVDTLKDE